MKLVHAQTVIEQDKLQLLEKLTGQPFVKDALTAAIDEYIQNHNRTADPAASEPVTLADKLEAK